MRYYVIAHTASVSTCSWLSFVSFCHNSSLPSFSHWRSCANSLRMLASGWFVRQGCRFYMQAHQVGLLVSPLESSSGELNPSWAGTYQISGPEFRVLSLSWRTGI